MYCTECGKLSCKSLVFGKAVLEHSWACKVPVYGSTYWAIIFHLRLLLENLSVIFHQEYKHLTIYVANRSNVPLLRELSERGVAKTLSHFLKNTLLHGDLRILIIENWNREKSVKEAMRSSLLVFLKASSFYLISKQRGGGGRRWKGARFVLANPFYPKSLNLILTFLYPNAR